MKAVDCYEEDGTPHTCWACGSKDIKHVTTNIVPVLDNGTGPECEFKKVCGNCDTTLAYWAYGSYDPAFMPGKEERQA